MKISSVRLIKKIFCILIIAGLFISCRKERDNEIVKITVPSTLSSIPLLRLNGLKLTGKTIEITAYSDHIAAMAEFINGSTDIILTGFTQGAANRKQNKTIVNISTIIWGVSSLMTADENISSLSDFTFIKAALPFQGSPIDVQFRYIAEQLGLSGNLDILYLPFQQAQPLLMNKTINLSIIPEPAATRLEKTGNIYRISALSELWAIVNNGDGRSPQVSLFSAKKFIDENKIFVDKFLDELRDSLEYTVNNIESTAFEYSSYFDLPEKVLADAMRNTLYEMPERDADYFISDSYLRKVDFSYIPERDFYYGLK